MTFLEFIFTVISALTGSAVFQFFQEKYKKNDVNMRVLLYSGGVLFGIIGAFALLSHFFLPDREIRRGVGIGMFIVVIVLFHRARLQLKKVQEQSNS